MILKSAGPRRATLGHLALMLPLAATAGAAYAQAMQSAQPLEPVTVVGTRLPVTPSGLAQNVTVIDRKEIQELNPARIEDLLSQVTGAYVDQAGAAGSFASLYMRGAENSHLLIMLDGVKLNDPTTTRGSAYDLSSIDISQIERIEVLRGPASAVYGGEALAGVINIITRRVPRDGAGGYAYGAAGGDHYRKLGGGLAFGGDTVRGRLSAGRTEDGKGDDGSLRLNTYAGALQLTPGAGVSAELFGHRVKRDAAAFPDDSGGPRLAVNRALTTRTSTDDVYGVRAEGGDTRSARLQAAITRFNRDEQSDNAFVDGGVRFPVPPFTSDTRFRRTNASISATHVYGTLAEVVAGYEYQQEDGALTSIGDFFGAGSPQTLSFALKRRTNSLFAEGRLRPVAALALQLGVRHDRVEGLSGRTTPHLGLVWDVATATTLTANYNQGFKPPSFFALGFPIGGNPDLRPERSTNAEVTLVQKLGGENTLQIGAFRTRYQDLVDFDGATFTNINRGKIVVDGIEPELRLRVIEKLRLQAGATLLRIDEKDGLQPLRNRPERRAAAALAYDVDERSSVALRVAYTGAFLDRSNPTGDIRMPGYTVADASFTFRYAWLRFSAAIDNLFDRQYEQFVGFPARGRRLRAEVRGEF